MFFDTIIENEYRSLGYRCIKRITSRIKDTICKNYDENFLKIEEKEIPEGIVYGAVTKKESITGTHQIVKRIVKLSLVNKSVKLPMETPTTKLGEILHTKKRYLAKLRGIRNSR